MTFAVHLRKTSEETHSAVTWVNTAV